MILIKLLGRAKTECQYQTFQLKVILELYSFQHANQIMK